VGLREDIYDRLLGEIREVSSRALDRLRELGEQLPDGVVEQVERLHADPTHERRKATRVNDLSIPVAVAAAGLPAGMGALGMKDHGLRGLAVLLPCPAGVGTVLRVRLPAEIGGGGWVMVEVKHCRREGKAWVAGCELLDDQPTF